MPTLDDILKDALVLDEHDRAALAERLLASLEQDYIDEQLDEAEIERAWADEAQRRLAEIESGKVKPVPAEEVHAKLAKLFP